MSIQRNERINFKLSDEELSQFYEAIPKPNRKRNINPLEIPREIKTILAEETRKGLTLIYIKNIW